MPQVVFLNCPEAVAGELAQLNPTVRVLVVFAPVDYGIHPEDQSPSIEIADETYDKVIVFSHAAVSGLDYRHPQCVDEIRSDKRVTTDAVSKFWRRWENFFRQTVDPEKLLLLRIPFQLFRGANDALNQALEAGNLPRRFAFDCSFQVISSQQLAAAVRLAIEKRLSGVFNCAPPEVIRSSSLTGITGVRSRYWTGEGSGRMRGVPGLSAGWWKLFRYPCTLDSSRFEQATGINWKSLPTLPGLDAGDDPFGLDPGTIRHTIWHRLAARKFWRLSVTGYTDIPKTGSAILIGPHRGFMPYDGVMMAYWMAVERNRMPRYLVHHCLLRYPLLGQYIRRIGGMPACKENALRVLRNGEILAVFPEGIQGTFRYYRQTYTLGSFGRGDYLRWALETDSPILPYVCIGPQEAYPIFFKINWPWWKRTVEWPAFPITATFPVIPLPMPTKWHFHFLAPINARERFPGLEPEDERGIRKASKQIRAELQNELLGLKARRSNWFLGELKPKA